MTSEFGSLSQEWKDALAHRSKWVLDNDDCLYPIECGLHGVIKQRICHHANATAVIRQKSAEWLMEDRNIAPADLGIVFPKIARMMAVEGDASLQAYLSEIYLPEDYARIPQDALLAQALNHAQETGCVGVAYNTSGPSALHGKGDSHLQHVLRAHGARDDVLAQSRRGDTTCDLINAIDADTGKPDKKQMDLFLKKTATCPDQAIYFDDSLTNLETGKSAGLLSVWTWTSNNQPSAENISKADDMGALRVRHVGAFLNDLLQYRLEMS